MRMDDSCYAIKARRIFCEEGIIDNAAVVVADGIIAAVSTADLTDRVESIIDCSEFQIIPGLFDTHIHGACGYDTGQGTLTALNEMSLFLARHGVTSFLAATVTDRLDKVQAALANIDAAMGQVNGARLLGAYVEGPYLGEKHRGAHPASLLRPPRPRELAAFLAAGGNCVKTVAISPDLPDALAAIATIRQKGVNVAVGHTDATYEQTKQAFDAGAGIAVHIFNGMRGLHHREPGVVGAGLTDDRVYVELIADYEHVHPAVMNIIFRCKRKDKVVLISDAMAAAGMPDGEYTLGTLKVSVENSVARAEDGSLAGSTTNLLACVGRLIEQSGLAPLDAVHMASLNPAKLYNRDGEIGSIRQGKRADLVVVDDHYTPVITIIGGRLVYRRS